MKTAKAKNKEDLLNYATSIGFKNPIIDEYNSSQTMTGWFRIIDIETQQILRCKWQKTEVVGGVNQYTFSVTISPAPICKECKNTQTTNPTVMCDICENAFKQRFLRHKLTEAEAEIKKIWEK